jgi:predicted ATPase
VRGLVATGMLEGARGSYRLARPFSGVEIPPTVQAVLAALVDALPPADKHLLQEAAVIGHEVPFALLRAICGLTADKLRSLLDNLQALSRNKNLLFFAPRTRIGFGFPAGYDC